MTPQQIIPLVAIAVAVAIILLRNRQPRTLRPGQMWIMPAIVGALLLFGLWGVRQAPTANLAPYGPVDWAMIAGGAVLGAAFGWWRGKMILIEKLPDGVLKAQASPIGLILILILVVGRQAARPYVEAHASAWHMNVTAVEQAFMVMALGLIVVQRIEIYIRARRIQAGGTDSHVETV